ncbi:hypothetical protein Lal_00014479 [Lupinus albus]|nr:hypothetical protein Lal_00014479 [Lupinus albus]
MSSQNEVNEEGTMVNIQIPITQTREPQIPQTQTQTQKRKPHGIWGILSVSRLSERSSPKQEAQYLLRGFLGILAWARYGSPGRGKSDVASFGSSDVASFGSSDVASFGSSDVASFGSSDVASFGSSDVASFGSSDITSFGSNYVARFGSSYVANFDSCYLEQSETPSPSSAAVEPDVLWLESRKNKQGVIDNEKVQEVVNRVVTLKERESFWTADSQDKYDSLVERFQAIEKRMETGKFVEWPAASTTVKESFTHPRNHIPIPKGIINNCKLFLDTPCTRAVAIGTMYNTKDAIIHHSQIPSNHLKVSIDISIEDDALLPIPVEEDIITVALALATFVALSKHLIDVVPNMGKVYADDLSATSPPIIDEPASKKAKVVKSKPQSSKSNLESYLYDNFVPKSKKKVMFISPRTNILGVGMVTNDTRKNEQAQYVAKIIEENKEIVDLFFAPLNTGQHWILVVINQVSHQLFYFDSIKNGNLNKYPLMQDIFNTTFNTYRGLNPKRQRPAKWTHVKILKLEAVSVELAKIPRTKPNTHQANFGSSDVANFGSSNVANFGSSDVANFGSSNVASFGSSDVASFGSSNVESFGSSDVASFGSSDVACLAQAM